MSPEIKKKMFSKIEKRDKSILKSAELDQNVEQNFNLYKISSVPSPQSSGHDFVENIFVLLHLKCPLCRLDFASCD